MRIFSIGAVLWGILPLLMTSLSDPLPQYAAVVEESEPEIPAEPEEEIILLLEGEELPVSSFPEIWGYLISGREQYYKPDMPISDIGYFGAEVNVYGQLVGVPNPKNIPGFTGRVHLVAACNGQALSHFSLMEGSQTRQKLIADLLAAAQAFDGLQIDFENVPARDGTAYRSFLAELSKGLGTGKMFTVALSARSKTLENDVYDYGKIKDIVDRILVMAYDEHWSGSKPGPIASMGWCRSVANYALKTVGPEKLIMGLPFYGRSWGNWNPSQAYIYSGIQRIKEERRITDIRRDQGIPNFVYEAPITATVYYEDDYSISNRLELYRGMGVRGVGFWRIGQESPTVWNRLKLIR
ncbi:MAG: glycoside hydrolase [Spirochaetaceae bacterium]|jgi:spore germination protein YaaH|nr:glycoside hydrolase [Spirochaetaceae bacterium]